MSRVAAQLEKKGIPVVLESFEDPGINKTAKRSFMREGVPMVREVLTPQDTTLKALPQKYTQKFIDALTRPLTKEEMASGLHEPPRNEGVFMTGSYDDVQKAFEGDLVGHPSIGPIAEMTDGLPVVPPTEKRVAEMLKGTRHDPDEPIVFTGVARGFSVARRLALLLTFPRFLPATGPLAMRSTFLMNVAVRVMANLVTDEDADWIARVWRRAGGGSRRLDRRPPFS